MGTKTITITDEAYGFLKALKGDEKSFSEAILSLKGKRGDLLRFAGILSNKRAEELKKEIKEMRKRDEQRVEELWR